MRNNSQHSSGQNGHYKLLRNIVICTMALVFLAGCDCEDPVIKTHQEALEALKKKVLSDPEYLKQLRAVGADESIFDDVQAVPRRLAMRRGLSDYPCNRPKKYSTYVPASMHSLGPVKIEDIIIEQINTFEIIKSSCNKCWNLVMISARITRCGRLYHIDIRSNPTPSIATEAGRKREQCGPAYDYP